MNIGRECDHERLLGSGGADGSSPDPVAGRLSCGLFAHQSDHIVIGAVPVVVLQQQGYRRGDRPQRPLQPDGKTLVVGRHPRL